MSDDSRRARAFLELWVEACVSHCPYNTALTECLIAIHTSGAFEFDSELHSNLSVILAGINLITLEIEDKAGEAIERVVKYLRESSPQLGGPENCKPSVDPPSDIPIVNVSGGKTKGAPGTRRRGENRISTPKSDLSRQLPRVKKNWGWKTERRLHHLNRIFGRKWEKIRKFLPSWSASQIKDKARRGMNHFSSQAPRPGDVSSDDSEDLWILETSSKLGPDMALDGSSDSENE